MAPGYKRLLIRPCLILAMALAGTLPARTGAAVSTDFYNATAGKRWIVFPDPVLETRGLPWLDSNAPDLWRLPRRAQGEVPKAAWARAVAPDGGRIRFDSDTTWLGIRAQGMRDAKQKCLFDVWAGTNYLGSATLTGTQRVELVLFESRDRAPTNITIYFPHKEEVRVLAVGVDERARLGAAPLFALTRPIVCYGSSVMQGSGAAHPSRTYPAALARRLNLDFVNFGFGGAGKAEPEVVRLINELDASCWLFDLGKSYGTQSAEPFERMLDAVRAAHPKVPIFCITPIYSVRENTDAAYRERSVNLRVMMRAAAEARQRTGDKSMFVIEGLDLFGDRDKDAFHDPTHPNDEGNERIAERLQLMVQKVNFGR